MVQTNARAASFVNVGLNALAHFQRTGNQFALVTNCLTVFLGIAYAEAEAIAFQFAFIANLAAGFRIERCFIQDNNRVLTCANAVYGFTVNKQRGHVAGQSQLFVAFKFRRAINADHRVVVRAKTAGFTRTTTLLFHCGFKACFVNFDVALAANVRRQVNREAVGVVQAESGFAIQRVALEFRQLVVQQRQSALQRTGKLLFFGFQNLFNLRLLAFQLVTGRAHHANQWPNEFIEEGVLRAQHVAMTDRTTNDTTQHIATVFIRRDNAVSNQERTRTNMVCDNAQ